LDGAGEDSGKAGKAFTLPAFLYRGAEAAALTRR
jgi:hypothetical protein